MNLVNGQVTEASNGGCCVCRTRQPPFHIHHVIPRAFGGNNGPLVKLCNSCHEGIHDAAKKKADATAYAKMEGTKAPHWQQSLVRDAANTLIMLIIRAQEVADTSDNKTTVISLTLDGRTNAILQTVAERLRVSKTQAIVTLIQSQDPASRNVKKRRGSTRQSTET